MEQVRHENKSAEPSVVTVNILSYQEKATRDQILKAYTVLTVRSRCDSNGICNPSCTRACAVKAPIPQSACCPLLALSQMKELFSVAHVAL